MTLTPEQILAEPPGRVLDALVAEHVLGWRWWRSAKTGRRCIYAPGKNPSWMQTPADGTEPLVWEWDTVVQFLPDFSTDIAAAWDVLRIASKSPWRGTFVYAIRDLVHRAWPPDDPDLGTLAYVLLDADAPSLFCKAALLAVDTRDA